MQIDKKNNRLDEWSRRHISFKHFGFCMVLHNTPWVPWYPVASENGNGKSPTNRKNMSIAWLVATYACMCVSVCMCVCVSVWVCVCAYAYIKKWIVNKDAKITSNLLPRAFKRRESCRWHCWHWHGLHSDRRRCWQLEFGRRIDGDIDELQPAEWAKIRCWKEAATPNK